MTVASLRKKSRSVFLLVAACLMLGALVMGVPGRVLAAGFGSEDFYGYFTGQQSFSGGGSNNGVLLPSGIYTTSASSFINTIHGDLESSNTQLHTVAAFIILTMLGKPPGTPKSAAEANYNTWKDLVNQYADANLIDWNMTLSECHDTYYQSGQPDIGDFRDCHYNDSFIAFKNPASPAGEPLYTIRRICGNPMGDLTPLHSLTTGYKFVGNTTVSTATAHPGDMVTFTSTIKNTGDTNGTVSSWNTFRKLNGGGSTATGSGTSLAINNGATKTTKSYNFTIPAAASNGDKYCEYESWKPQTPSDGSTKTDAGACVTVAVAPVTASCTALPAGTDATRVPVTLPPESNNPDTWDYNGTRYYAQPSPLTPGDTIVYVHRYPTKYTITSVQNHYGAGAGSITISQQPSGTSNVGYLDFTNAIKRYPYDTNTADVHYKETYGYTRETGTVQADGSIAWGSPTTVSSSGTWPPSGTYSTAQDLGECVYRQFTVKDPSDTDVTGVLLNNDYENPTSATVGDQVAVHLTLPNVPAGWTRQIRAPLKVSGIRGQPTYEVRRYTGAMNPLATGGNDALPHTFACSGTTIDCVDPDSSYQPSTSVQVGNGATDLHPGDEVCAQLTIQPGSGEMDETGAIQTSSGSVQTTDMPTTNNCSAPVINKPYFKVFGGDISAGDGFTISGTSTCSVPSSGNIYGWNTANDGAYSQHYAGAGAQFSVMALDAVNGVSSDQNNLNASPGPSHTAGVGLSFANATSGGAIINSTGGNFAYGFGASPSCIPDYYDDQPLSGVSNIAGSISINGSYDGTYNFTSASSTISGGHIPPGHHVVIYATGTVNITDNIVFNGGSYSDITHIPSFILVVKGNINISNSVTQLDGIYIAQPSDPVSPTDGIISDCAQGGVPVAGSNLFNSCDNRLVVNGSFIAEKINLLRTGPSAGDPYRINPSLRGATSNETNATSGTVTEPASATNTCSGGTAPGGDGTCGPATYHPGSTSYGPWSAWSADTRGCGTTSGSPRTDTSTTQYNNQYVSGLCASGYRWQSRSIFASSSYYSCPSGETRSGSMCMPSTSYTCPDGSAPDASHMCTMTVTPTYASEIFNYGPAFWMNAALPNPTTQSVFKYDSITSLPPVL